LHEIIFLQSWETSMDITIWYRWEGYVDITTLVKVVGRLVQDYERYKGLNEDFTTI